MIAESDEKMIALRVRQIITERYDVKTFVFERTDGGVLTYKAGQFLTFLLNFHGTEIRRSYSLSSAPGIDPFPAITVKRVANGEVSRQWIDGTVIGDVFYILAPAGRFTLDANDGPRDIVLIAAGSGITPVFSLMKQALTGEGESNITLLYANRNQQHTIFDREIEIWQKRFYERLHVIHVHSQPSDDWHGMRGRINNARLEHLLLRRLHFEPEKARFFICGPYPFMRTIEITLHYLGFVSSQIRKENFVIDGPAPAPPASSAHTIQLNFLDRHYQLNVPPYTTILDAALKEGIRLPYSCKGGRCSTCACICIRGKVHMSTNEVLTDAELAEGWILTCSAYPDSDDVFIELK
jgi:2Fe-2S type ferredoxin